MTFSACGTCSGTVAQSIGGNTPTYIAPCQFDRYLCKESNVATSDLVLN